MVEQAPADRPAAPVHGRSAPAASMPLVSVVVPTYRRALLLTRLFAALALQSLGTTNFELVVVDDASPDGTVAALRELAEQAPFATTVLRSPVNAGPAAARNRGWQAARGGVVAFTDDDCTPMPGWLAAGLRALGPRGRVVVGRTMPDPDQLGQLGLFSRTMQVEDASFMQTCNVFYRRADLDRVGGFDERLRTGEDIDLGLRVVAAGTTAVYAPEALVHHDVRASSLRASLREAWSWADLPLVVRKHPGVRRSHAYRRIFWKRSHPPTLLALVGLMLAPRRPVAAVLLVPWLRLRLVTAPLAPGRTRRVVVLPGAFAVDAVEVAALVRGSLRHRTLYL